MNERRKTTRERTNGVGNVRAGTGRGIECVMRDASGDGAGLSFMHRRTILPKRFVLTTTPDGTQRSCLLVWQSDYRAGIRFGRED
ncbi:hypothetical protein [Pseudorhodoplanes sp.]|uniref:hypothetical protein n=1 Tax=Pseudorhodoplanes sp. TaxID=1934341 RepID=UPI003918E5B7